MAQIVFNSDEQGYERSRYLAGRRGLVGLVMRLGARSEGAANLILFFLALIIFGLAAVILFKNL